MLYCDRMALLSKVCCIVLRVHLAYVTQLCGMRQIYHNLLLLGYVLKERPKKGWGFCLCHLSGNKTHG